MTTDQSAKHSWRRPALVVFQIIAILVIPSALTLMSVEDPGELVFDTDNPTPLGYTWSLLLFQ